MRVLHIMAAKGNGGAELYSTDVMLALHKAGIEQSIVMHPSALRSSELKAAGLSVQSDILAPPIRALQRMRLRRHIAAFQPEIIHCWMRRAASLVPASAKNTIPVIGWFGDYERLKHFSACSYFVGCTQDLADYMQQHGVPAARAAYVATFPSVDDAPALNRASLATPASAKVLLTLSRLHKVKGLDTMITAMAQLTNCYLWIAGDGPMQAELASLAKNLGIYERVKFLGWRTDRGALLRAVDICVLPSRYEPFGTVILDAWSTKTALVAADAAGPKAHIQNAINGMLTPAGDAAGLAAAINQLLKNPLLQQKIIGQGYADYLANFTLEKVTAAWIEYYTGLVKAGRL